MKLLVYSTDTNNIVEQKELHKENPFEIKYAVMKPIPPISMS